MLTTISKFRVAAAVAGTAALLSAGLVIGTGGTAHAAGTYNVMFRPSPEMSIGSVVIVNANGSRSGCSRLINKSFVSTGFKVNAGDRITAVLYSDAACQTGGASDGSVRVPSTNLSNFWYSF